MRAEKEFRTSSSILVKSVYTPLDLQEDGFDYLRDLGSPGTYPFVRGIEPDMYRGNLWIMGQLGGYGTPEDTNKRLKYLIEQGVTGIGVALDMPKQLGYDSDHPMAHGEVGKVGVAIDSLKDMEIIFDGIPLNSVRQCRIHPSATSTIFIALFLAMAEKQGIDPRDLSLLLQNDVLKEYVARGAYFLPPRAAVKLCTDVIEYCTANLPDWIPINFCGYHMREAGCTAVQEIAFTFANGIAYIESTLARGMHIDQFAPKLACMFSARTDIFEEVAKFRAARRVWGRLMKERFGASDPRSLSLKIFCFTAGSTLIRQEPINNIIRITLEALAGVLGGIQILHTSSYDETYATPSKEGAKIALRTQQIIAHESGVINTVDPLGGSFYLEKLTNEIEEKVWKYIKKIDEMGGAITAIENRFFQNEIEEAAYQFQNEIENKERIIVGLNEYRSGDVMKIQTLKIDPLTEEKQVRSLLEMKRSRDNARVKKALATLKQIAIDGQNVIPGTLDAVKAYATVGEICSILKEVFGENKESSRR